MLADRKFNLVLVSSGAVSAAGKPVSYDGKNKSMKL